MDTKEKLHMMIAMCMYDDEEKVVKRFSRANVL